MVHSAAGQVTSMHGPRARTLHALRVAPVRVHVARCMHARRVGRGQRARRVSRPDRV